MNTSTVTEHQAVQHLVESGATDVYARGNIELLDARPVVTITGARACSGYGSLVASEVAEEAVKAGANVATGGAYGIDAAVIRTTLEADGTPIIWFAGGLDRAYPSSHTEMLDRVLEAGGLLLSLQPDGTPPTRERFHARNQALGSYANITVIVEAGRRSGTLRVADAALDAGQHVIAVPGPITSAAYTGTNQLLANPKVAPLVTSHTLLDYLK